MYHSRAIFYTQLIWSDSARNYTNFPALSCIDTFSEVPNQCPRGSSCIPIFPSIHPFRYLASHSPYGLCTHSPHATRTPSHPVHLLTVPTSYPRNSYPPSTGSFAPPSHFASQGPRFTFQQPWEQEHHCLCSGNRRTSRFGILFCAGIECGCHSPGR